MAEEAGEGGAASPRGLSTGRTIGWKVESRTSAKAHRTRTRRARRTRRRDLRRGSEGALGTRMNAKSLPKGKPEVQQLPQKRSPPWKGRRTVAADRCPGAAASLQLWPPLRLRRRRPQYYQPLRAGKRDPPLGLHYQIQPHPPCLRKQRGWLSPRIQRCPSPSRRKHRWSYCSPLLNPTSRFCHLNLGSQHHLCFRCLLHHPEL